MENASVVHCIYRAGNVDRGSVPIVGRYQDRGVAEAEAHKLTDTTGVLHEVETRGATWGPAMPAR